METAAEAVAVLGVTRDADHGQVRATYRRLAFENHPDRNGNSPASFARFKRIARAYKILEAKFRLEGAEGSSGPCAKCGRFALLRAGLDRNRYCTVCLLTVGGRRALPAPPVIIAGCGFAIAALVLAIVSLGMLLATARPGYGALSLGASGAALTSLAVTAVSAGYSARARRRFRG